MYISGLDLESTKLWQKAYAKDTVQWGKFLNWMIGWPIQARNIRIMQRVFILGQFM